MINYATLIIIASMLLLCITAIPFVIHKGADIFEPIYLSSIVFALHFPIHSLIAINNGSHILGEPPFNNDIMELWIEALIYLMMCFIVFLFGYYSASSRKPSFLLCRHRLINRRKALVTAVILFFIGSISFYLLINHFGGLYYYLLNKYITRTAWGIGYYTVLTYFICYASLIIFVLPKSNIILKSTLIVSSILLNIASGSRGALISYLLSLVVCRHYLFCKFNISKMIGFLAALIPIMTLGNIYRNNTSIDLMLAELKQANLTRYMLEPLQRAYGLDAIIVILKEIKNGPLLLGETIYPILIAWVPRFLWENKPLTSPGKLYAETYFRGMYMDETAVSATIIGDAIANFHILGAILTSFLSGFVIKIFYNVTIKNRVSSKSYTLGVFVYSTSFTATFFFWENAIIGAITSYMPTLVLTFLISYFISSKSAEGVIN